MYGNKDLQVSINKAELLGILVKNRKQHEADYQRAKASFVALLEKELTEKLSLLQSGKSVDLSFNNRKPDHHADDYDDVIGMLELATDVKIKLNHEQYKHYVKDEWDWKRLWSTSNAVYLSAAIGE